MNAYRPAGYVQEAKRLEGLHACRRFVRKNRPWAEGKLLVYGQGVLYGLCR